MKKLKMSNNFDSIFLTEDAYKSVLCKRYLRTHTERPQDSYFEELQLFTSAVIRNLANYKIWPSYKDQVTKPLTERDIIKVPEKLEPYLEKLEGCRLTNMYNFFWDGITTDYLESFLTIADNELFLKEQKEKNDNLAFKQSMQEFDKKMTAEQNKRDQFDRETEKKVKNLLDKEKREKLLKELEELVNTVTVKQTSLKYMLETVEKVVEDKANVDTFALIENLNEIRKAKDETQKFTNKFEKIFRELLSSIHIPVLTNNHLLDEFYSDSSIAIGKCSSEGAEVALFLTMDTDKPILDCQKSEKTSNNLFENTKDNINYTVYIQILPKIPKQEDYENFDSILETIPKLIFKFDKKIELVKMFSVFENLFFQDLASMSE